jgi:hypothetical protein
MLALKEKSYWVKTKQLLKDKSHRVKQKEEPNNRAGQNQKSH